MRGFGGGILGIPALAAIAAPALAPHGAGAQYASLLNAPPTIPHLIDDAGTWHAPFIYPWTLANRLEQRFEQDRSTREPLAWFTAGHLVQSPDDPGAPLAISCAATLGRPV